uniref:Uncharacterized protein n=1 Tax=uncultured marine group II/III euryarchaeote AD1000_11_G05 TaxID=1457723 RepID=A0A075FJJ0_9EURY|nr:hypothetical protein [uncultured marine group II/III euryarchaeote AD1000_11_G05]
MWNPVSVCGSKRIEEIHGMRRSLADGLMQTHGFSPHFGHSSSGAGPGSGPGSSPSIHGLKPGTSSNALFTASLISLAFSMSFLLTGSSFCFSRLKGSRKVLVTSIIVSLVLFTSGSRSR